MPVCVPALVIIIGNTPEILNQLTDRHYCFSTHRRLGIMTTQITTIKIQRFIKPALCRFFFVGSAG